MANLHPPKYTPAQPKSYKVNLKAILSLPVRLCNPPPSVGKVRSCGVTPLLKVRLEDVLNRKHLPPLGLKDFEEWLLFVEMSPENLYFTLWLQDYKQKYAQWKSQATFQQNNTNDYPLTWVPQHSSHLAMFYARAKQTFLTPNAEYELNLASNLLAPFHKANMPPHPDPATFDEVAIETHRMLEESLRRFVNAQLNNVGNQRVLCGIIAGMVFALLGSIPVLAVNFTRGDSRWLRLTAIPGIWLGLTILLSALNGICLGVYVFGDLRQLRKFELSRPQISKPQPLPVYKRWSMSGPRPQSRADSILPVQQGRKFSVPDTQGCSACTQLTRIVTGASNRTHLTTSETSSDNGIHISPMYYDDEGDGMATYSDSECHGVATVPVQVINDALNSPTTTTFTATASFIHPFELTEDDESEFERALQLPERNQRVAPFSFDSLPKRHNRGPSTPRFTQPFTSPYQNQTQIQMRHESVISPTYRMPPVPQPVAPKSWLARMQERCSLKRRPNLQLFIDETQLSSTPSSSVPPTPTTLAPFQQPYLIDPSRKYSVASIGTQFSSDPHLERSRMPQLQSQNDLSTTRSTTVTDVDDSVSKISEDSCTEEKVRKRFRMMNAVPAFAVPLTRVLSPVVVRGQWEIVVRSAVVALIIALSFVAAMIAIPPVRS